MRSFAFSHLPQACTVAAASLSASCKSLMKVTNYLPDSVVRSFLKNEGGEKNGTDHRFARQLAPLSVAIPTYAFKIIKIVALNMAVD